MNSADAKKYLLSRGKIPSLDEEGKQEFHWSEKISNLRKS